MKNFTKKNIKMGILSKLFGGGRKERVIQLMVEGAVIIDVRTPGEFKG